MKLLLDFFPIVLFFLAYKFAGIYWATGIAIVGTILQILYAYVTTRRIDKLLWLSFAIILILGSLTLFLHNPVFIKWKPTVLYWGISVSLCASSLLFGRNLIRKAMEKELQLPDHVWTKLNGAWIVFFGLMGGLNLYVAFNFAEATWVNFKLFGSLGLMLVFILVQGLLISRYIQDEQEK